MTTPGRAGWAGARCLLVAHAGDPEGHAALGPALRALAARAERTGGRVVGLWEGAPPPPARGVADRDLRLGPALGVDLGGEAVDGAVVLADPGRTALDLALALHLAGVPLRAGASSEFGGGVLTDPVPLPADLPPEERHLAVLTALGLWPVPRRHPADGRILSPGGET